MSKKVQNALFLLLAILLPFALYTYTQSDSMNFSDAGEFGIVTYIGSVAHGPGFPAYVLFGWIWSSLFTVFTGSHLISITLFSVASTAAACGLLYLTAYRLLQRNYSGYSDLHHCIVALCTALAFATGFTIWYWANNVEVYGFHVFAFSLMLYGLLEFNHSRGTSGIVMAAVGMALGLACHHLTILFFLPFTLFFFGKNIFIVNQKDKPGVKKKRTIQRSADATIWSFFKSKQFKIFAFVSGGLIVCFYGWMMMRAGLDLPFKFGQPDNLERLYFHVSGGAFIDKMTERAEGMVAMRLPYFMWLMQRQFSFFLVLMVLALVVLFQKGYMRLALVLLGYFLVVQFYQLGLDQFYDSDGYMVLPYYLLSLTIPFGALWLMEKKTALVYILPVLVLVQVVRNFPISDKRNHNVGKSLMEALDKSAPKNSVIIASDWSLVGNYNFYRIVENFRPDLTVLNYDLKFTNYRLLPVMYPEFYKLIKAEYDAFIEKFRASRPEQIYDTGASFDTEVFEAYKKVIYKIRSICNASGRAMLIDPEAFVFFNKQNVFSPEYYPSGCFMSKDKIDNPYHFEKLESYKWLDIPLVKYEANSSDKLVDIQAMLQFNSQYFIATGDTARNAQAVKSYNKIMAIQKDLKKHLPFIYRQ